MDQYFTPDMIKSMLAHTACELQGVFTQAELEAIIKSMCSTPPVPHAAGSILQQECMDLARFDWCLMHTRIDIPSFLSKVRSLSQFHAAYLEVWGYHYWRTDMSMDTYTFSLCEIDKKTLQ